MKLKPVVTTVGRLRCPVCKGLQWSVLAKGDEYECNQCKAVSQKSKWQIVELKATGYVCPNCGERVADVSENYSMCVWGGPEPVLVCPKCLTTLKGYLHHEDPHGAKIRIKYEETGGYIDVWHEDCPKAKAKLGHMTLERLCVDAETEHWLKQHDYKGRPKSRVVLVYVCDNCGKQQVVKASLEDVRIWNSNWKRWWR